MSNTCGFTLILLLTVCTGLMQAGPLEKVALIYVEGDSQAASYVREKLKLGYECLELAKNRTTADAMLQMHASVTASRGMMGESKHFALVSGLLEDPLGVHLWDFTRRTPGAGIEEASDAILKRLARDSDCKRRLKQRKSAAPLGIESAGSIRSGSKPSTTDRLPLSVTSCQDDPDHDNTQEKLQSAAHDIDPSF